MVKLKFREIPGIVLSKGGRILIPNFANVQLSSSLQKIIIIQQNMN